VGERERREGRGRGWVKRWATATTVLVGPAHVGRRERGKGEEKEMGCGYGPSERMGERLSPSGFSIFLSLFYFPDYICICLNDFEFKFECMSMQKCTTISSTSQANIHTQSFTHQVFFPILIYFANIIYVGYIF